MIVYSSATAAGDRKGARTHRLFEVAAGASMPAGGSELVRVMRQRLSQQPVAGSSYFQYFARGITTRGSSSAQREYSARSGRI